MRASTTTNAGARKLIALLSMTISAAAWTGCAATQERAEPKAPTMADIPEVPTVPPRSAPPTPPPHAVPKDPQATPEPLEIRPVPKTVALKPGQAAGPIVTFFGAARADGLPVKPTSVSKDGIETYTSTVGSGFILVVEGKPGANNIEVGRGLYAHAADDPTKRGDLEIISNRDLGDGSPAVCDRQRPNIGGIPAINPPSFEPTQKISNAINDFACRFETFVESDFSCTMNEQGSYAFANKETKVQFCLIIARAYGFPVGTTELSVRLRDTDGNPGPVKKVRIHRPEEAAAPKAEPTPTKSPRQRTEEDRPKDLRPH
jgi:hypothetical protein